MTLPGIYLDEDAQSGGLIAALRARGISVATTSEVDMGSSTDEEQLQFATSRSMVLTTCNIAHFARLHTAWLVAGRDHAGIILIQQQTWSPGELARRINRVLAATPSQDMRNRLEFVSNW